MPANDDYALVFNAGSSSLKFCVYRRPAEDTWRLGARGHRGQPAVAELIPLPKAIRDAGVQRSAR